MAGYWGGESWRIDNQMSIINNSAYNPWNIRPEAATLACYFDPGDGAAWDAFDQARYGIYGIGNLENRKNEKAKYQSYGISSFIAYEGGQHCTENSDTFNKNSEMYNLYTEWLNKCSEIYDVICHYTHAGNFGSGGAWGAKEYVGQSDYDSHKYRAIKDWIYSH